MGVKIIAAGIVIKSVIFWAMGLYINQWNPGQLTTPDFERYLKRERAKVESESVAAQMEFECRRREAASSS